MPASITTEQLQYQPALDEAWPNVSTASGMSVRKRNGSLESVDVNKIVRAVGRCAAGLPKVDVMRGAVKTSGGLYDGATTCELDQLSIRTAAFVAAHAPKLNLAEVFDEKMDQKVIAMLREAVECQTAFAEDVLAKGVAGMSIAALRKYLEYVPDRRVESLGIMPIFGSKDPFDFMQLQDVQELTNFFERRVSAYQRGITGDLVFSEEF